MYEPDELWCPLCRRWMDKKQMRLTKGQYICNECRGKK